MMGVAKSKKSKAKVKTKRMHIKMRTCALTKNTDGQIHIRHFVSDSK